MLKGIDVSRWQQTINWPLAKTQIDFAIIKIGGSDDGMYMDGQAVRNALEARSVGVAVGWYVYLGGHYPVADEVQHIKNLITNIGGLKPGEPICLDWEETHPNEVQYVYGIAKGLIDAGFPAPLIYMSLSRVRQNDWKSLVDLNCGLWVAAWGNNDSIADAAPPSDEWPMWALWQFSSTGNVAGISGKVDLDYFQGDLAAFHKYGGTRTVTMPAPINVGKALGSQGTTEYTVQRGDSLSLIAQRFGKSWQDLWTMNRDRVSDPNRIFPGQKLRVPFTPDPVAPPLPTSTHQDNTKYHTVENGENLSVIASRYALPSWTYLWEANRDIIPDPNLIRPGQRLRIP